jgi:hypothetical protein
MRNKPQRKGDLKMKTRSENEKYLIFVVADIKNRKLLVPSFVMSRIHILKSGEASLFNEYKARYPGFEVTVI